MDCASDERIEGEQRSAVVRPRHGFYRDPDPRSRPGAQPSTSRVRCCVVPSLFPPLSIGAFLGLRAFIGSHMISWHRLSGYCKYKIVPYLVRSPRIGQAAASSALVQSRSMSSALWQHSATGRSNMRSGP
jgi:hypothetical protein